MCAELAEGAAVAIMIAGAFGLPEGGVGARLTLASFTSMHVPKTSVDKDDRLNRFDNKIRMAWQACYILSKAKPHTMQDFTDIYFRRCTVAFYGCHNGTSLGF